jgi:hypothetical protein
MSNISNISNNHILIAILILLLVLWFYNSNTNKNTENFASLLKCQTLFSYNFSKKRCAFLGIF